jgi:hypothetical protein
MKTALFALAALAASLSAATASEDLHTIQVYVPQIHHGFSPSLPVSIIAVTMLRRNGSKFTRHVASFPNTAAPDVLLDSKRIFIRTAIHRQLRQGDIYEEGLTGFVLPLD